MYQTQDNIKWRSAKICLEENLREIQRQACHCQMQNMAHL